MRLVTACLAVLLSAGTASAASMTVTLTSDDLGLGTNAINNGNIVDADVATKLFTAAQDTVNSALNTALGLPAGTINEGSVLNVQTNGDAGVTNQLVQITSATHLDVTSGYPATWGVSTRDYQAGVIYLTDDGSDASLIGEGLGVKAFTVGVGTGATGGYRKDDDGKDPKDGNKDLITGNDWAIEGSKEVSGGPPSGTTYDAEEPNVHPKVDELAFFDFTPYAGVVAANNFSFTLTKFDASALYSLLVTYGGGGTCTFSNLGTGSGTFNAVDLVLTVDASTLGCLPNNQELLNFYIRAESKLVGKDAKEAEQHFLINSFTVNDFVTPGGQSAGAVPEPSTLLLLGTGLAIAARRLRKRKA